MRDFQLSPELLSHYSAFEETLELDPEYVKAVQVDLPNVMPKVVKVDITAAEAAELKKEMDAVAPLATELFDAQGYHGYSAFEVRESRLERVETS